MNKILLKVPYFNNHMSYSEIIFALSEILSQNRYLSRSEINCLNSSVSDPFVKAVIQRYPLSSSLEKCVEQSLQRERALRPNIDINVHSAIYGRERNKMAIFLKKNFPPQLSMNVIERTKDLVHRFIQEENKSFDRQLLIAEKARFEERQRNYRDKKLSNIAPQESLAEIKQDFIAYVDHLERAKNNNSTFSWDILNSLFQRIDTFTEDSNARTSAELMLLSALDEARTAYHAEQVQHIQGKNYSCHQGFEERLLDTHFFLIPPENINDSALQHFIDNLLGRFIIYDNTMKEEGYPPVSSGLLYAIYFQAAGYNVEKQLTQTFCLKNGVESEIEGLKKKFKGAGLNSAIQLLGAISCSDLEKNFSVQIEFLSKHHMLETRELIEELVQPPAQAKTKEAIYSDILDSKIFLNRAHLEMLLAITRDPDFKKMEQLATYSDIPIFPENTQLPSQQEFECLYRGYLDSDPQAFCHYYDEETVSDRLMHNRSLSSLNISEAVLCHWLEKHFLRLPVAKACNIAVLCAQEGYARALGILCDPLVKHSIDPDYFDLELGRSLLQLASSNGHTDSVKALIGTGAHANLQDRSGFNALMLATQNGHLESVKVLLEAATDLSLQNEDGQTALMLASECGETSTVSLLLRAGSPVNFQDEDGWTALIWASMEGHANSVRILLEAKADIDLQSNEQVTALMIASKDGHTQTVKVLIDAGASLNAQGKYGITSLIFASMGGHTDTIKTLLQAGANPNLQSDNGWNPLMWASKNGDIESLKALLEAKCDMSLQNEDGKTALMIAAEYGQKDCMKMLIDNGAAVDF